MPARVAGLLAELVEDGSVRYPTPGLVDQMEYLYRLTQSADQRLGQDVSERLVELRAAFERARARFEEIERGRR